MANHPKTNTGGKGGDNRTADDVDGNRSGDPGDKRGGGQGIDQSDDKGNANKGGDEDDREVLPPTPPLPLPRR